MLTDLERDIVYLLEDKPGFEGAWRLASTGDPARCEVAVAVREKRAWRVHLEWLRAIPPAEHAKILVFDPAIGEPLSLRRATRLSLDAAARAEAPASIDARLAAAERVVEAELREIQARRSVVVVESAPVLAKQLTERFGNAVAVDRASTAFFAVHRWWWSNRASAADVVILDAQADDVVKLAPSLLVQPRYVGRVFVARDRGRFAFARKIARPMTDDDLTAVARAFEQPRVVDVLGAEPDLPCVVVVDTKRGFGRLVRRALDDAEVIRVDKEWEALDVIAKRRVECVLMVFTRRGDAERFARFRALFDHAQPGLGRRVLFVTDDATKRRLDLERPAVAHRFIARDVDEDALRTRLFELVTA